MKSNVILAGVGGQGILTIAYCLCNAALKRGLNFKQAEVHGMAQRGGAVVSHLRISPEEIYSDLVPEASANLLLAIEPLEALRYCQYLSRDGAVVANSAPVTNIPNYPDLDGVLERITRFADHVMIDANYLAAVAGSGRAANTVMLGAGGHRLGFALEEFEPHIRALFGGKSPRLVDTNCRAMQLGQLAADLYREHRQAGMTWRQALTAISEVPQTELVERAAQHAVGS
jgi:indolepyruvate ferredoxin oxidoreductase beta subunit